MNINKILGTRPNPVNKILGQRTTAKGNLIRKRSLRQLPEQISFGTYYEHYDAIRDADGILVDLRIQIVDLTETEIRAEIVDNQSDYMYWYKVGKHNEYEKLKNEMLKSLPLIK